MQPPQSAAAALLLLAPLCAAAPSPAQDLPPSSAYFLGPDLLLSSDPFVRAPARAVAETLDPRRRRPVERIWRGLRVQPEFDCSPFDPADYGLPPVLVGTPPLPAGVVGGRDPLSCSYPRAAGRAPVPAALVDPESAHRRGLCARSSAVRRLFPIDGGNVLPSPVSPVLLEARAAVGPGWLPPFNACWYAARRIRIHQRWGLAVPREEAVVFQDVLARCPPLSLAQPSCTAAVGTGTGW